MRASLYTMKFIPALALLLSGITCHAASNPSPHARERYDGTMSKSPFALATKVEAAVVEAPKVDPFKDMFITGLGKADGFNYVVVQRVGAESFRLFGTEPGPEGIRLVKVNWQDIPGKSTVTVKKGSDTGDIKFNEAQTAPVPSNNGKPGMQPGAGNPNIPVAGNPGVPTRNSPGNVQPRNGNNSNGVIVNNVPQPGNPGNPNGAVPNMIPTINNTQPASPNVPPDANGVAGGSPSETGGRRRIRTINNR